MSKLNIKKGHIISAAILLGFAILIVALKPGKTAFQLSAEETMDQTVKRSHLISYSRYHNLRASEVGPVMLVDLRPEAEFEAGHLPEAVNIPFENLLDKTSLSLLRQADIIKVMYSDSSYKAAQAWSILYQMGCMDMVILETTGSLDDIIEKGSDADQVMIYNDERKQFKFVPDTTVSDYFPET